MKAAFYERKGAARDVLRISEVETPRPAEGEVLVRVHASGVNPSDTKRRGTLLGAEMPFPRIIPHQDGAGVIEAVGPGVPNERIGERVWLFMAQWQRPFGTAAQYVSLPAFNAVPLPGNTEFTEGACLGIPAITAHYCLEMAMPLEGKRVLVAGGMGAVGFYAVQLARRAGAEVIATVSTPEQELQVRALGATHVLQRRNGNLAAAIMEATRGEGVHHIVEVAFGENLAANVEVLRAGGSLATFASDAQLEPVLPFHKLMYKDVKLHFALLYLAPREALRRATAEITTALRAGQLRHSIAVRLPLERIVEAHEAVERGHNNGKVILDL